MKKLLRWYIKMKERLEQLAEQIEREILETGTLVIKGIPAIRTSRRTPHSGLCQNIPEKLKELGPDLKIKHIYFMVSARYTGWRTGHSVAEVVTSEGDYIVDPTIKQFIPDAKMVYGPEETYLVLGAQRQIDFH